MPKEKPVMRKQSPYSSKGSVPTVPPFAPSAGSHKTKTPPKKK